MAILHRILNLFRRNQLNREIAAELEAHIALRTEANLAAGMSPADAQRDARLRFGNPSLIQERVAATDASLGLENLVRDLRYAARRLRHGPGFAISAILTLALGIGANVVVFGVLNALLLRPLNVAGADRLLQVSHQESDYLAHSYLDYVDFRARNTAFTDMALYRINSAAMSTGGQAQSSIFYEASGNYFDMLGVQPALGRFFHGSDEHGPNSAPYAVLSDGFWRSRFNADPRVIGMKVDLNKHPYTILGVSPATFHGTELFMWPDFWVPVVNAPEIEGDDFLNNRQSHGSFVIGMLKPGVSSQQATENLNTVARQMTKEHPAEDDGLKVRLIKPGLMGDAFGGAARAFLTGVFALALLVLAAACFNLAGIFAARSADRTRELAIRLSIGSTRWRILRQFLYEALLISVAGGMVGTVVAEALMHAISRWQPIPEYPIRVAVVSDARVYAIAGVLALLSGLLPGFLSARQIWRTNTMQAMKAGTGTQAVLGRLSIRDVLLVGQITVCALLITASLVSLRGMSRSLHASFGFVPQGAIVVDSDTHAAGYSNDTAKPLLRRILEQCDRIPGVTGAGSVDERPLSGRSNTGDVFRDGTTDTRSSNSITSAQFFSISPGYLNAARTRLLAGRDFTWQDDAKHPHVMLINQTLAQKAFGNQSPLGRFLVTGDKVRHEIVGVVEDGKYQSLTEDPRGAMFFPVMQGNAIDLSIIVRSGSDPSEVARSVKQVLAGVDSSLPVRIENWTNAMSLVLFPARAATATLGVMGLLAALLAITGMFGMAAYSVSKRLRELGLRVALGAGRARLMRSALGKPLILLLSGCGLGLLGGVLASRVLASIVYQASPRDPWVLAGAMLTMAGVGLVATWLPARRAYRLNPAQLLREE